MKVRVTEELLDGKRLREGAFAENEELTEVILPEDLEDIGEVAFFGCRSLKKIVLPPSLKIIREEAFGESGLLAVTIPEGAERICEKAFFSCENLRRIDVLPKKPVIEADAFGDCPRLLEGYVACGYPDRVDEGWENARPDTPDVLLYTLLWCTCPERHLPETTRRAEEFIRKNEALIMERIIKANNTAAMSGLAERKLLKPENISKYVTAAGQMRQAELVALLISAADPAKPSDEFEL